jgi:DNA-directed RNA polymerase subunit RPC12/RpoP
MTFTSDERRDVAKKIRKFVDVYGDKIEDAEMVLLGTVCRRGEFGEVVRPTSEVELLAMVADLIDPVCHVSDKEITHQPTLDAMAVHVYTCDSCSSTFYMGDVCIHPEPLYCPHCGARVTSGGEG